jgi:hypothetical protein
MASGTLSRRDFLKLTGMSLFGLMPAGTNSYPIQGRVQATILNVRTEPAFSARKIATARRDDLLEIKGGVDGGEPGDYNRLWYMLASGYYVYSGWIQTIWPRRNPIVMEIPGTGVLGEVTIPFADMYHGINSNPLRGQRLYYGTTHWITAIVTDKRDGGSWYKAHDVALGIDYYIRPECIHLFSKEELAPISGYVQENEKWIEIHLGHQILLAYEAGRPVFSARVSTGTKNYETPTGSFRTFHKRPTYHMYGGADASSMFDLPGVPWDTYITETGVALHGTYWHNDFGTPHSHGCINMAIQDAKWIFRWTTPVVSATDKSIFRPGSGTLVIIS